MKTYIIYSDQQKEFIKNNYHHMSNAELAAALGIGSPAKVRELARRLCVKWRAENGAPRWREPKTPNHNLHRWAA